MKIKLFDCEDKISFVDVGDIKEIGSMYIEVISGDEVLFVVYKNYIIKEFDSSHTRCEDRHESRYLIYNEQIGINLLKDEDFLNRKDSYDYLYKDFYDYMYEDLN